MTIRADRELWATARLVERLAERIGQVRVHVRTELTYADGHADHTPGASDLEGRYRPPLSGDCLVHVPIDAELDVWRVCGLSRPCSDHDRPVSLTAVERAAERRLQLAADLADFEAQCKLIVVAASDAMRSADRMIGTRLEVEKITECRDGQHGKSGSIEWGDPTCLKEAVKSNMCQAHAKAWYRWRKDQGHDVSSMHEPGTAA
jgi:hypothetical protein